MDGTEKTGKKLSLVYILLILKKYSDLQHALSQQDILQYLEKDYGMVIARKSVKRNLEALRTAGLPVRCREVRRSRSEKEEMISLDWYYEHLLEENELSALLDGLYFSHGNYGFIKATAGKIRREASPFADGDRDFMRNIPAENKKSDDGETGKTLRIIADAVRQKHKISFFYDHYEADGKKHHNQYPAGVDQKYEVSPYWVLTADWPLLSLCLSLSGRRSCIVSCGADIGSRGAHRYSGQAVKECPGDRKGSFTAQVTGHVSLRDWYRE